MASGYVLGTSAMVAAEAENPHGIDKAAQSTDDYLDYLGPARKASRRRAKKERQAESAPGEPHEQTDSERGIKRYELNDQWAHAGMVEAGGFVYTSYCVGNTGQPIEDQVNGAFDHLQGRLERIGLTLSNVIHFTALFHDINDIPVMEKVVKERFPGEYPARKSVQTKFGGEGILFQLDAVAYREP
ncbi:MAG: RidA family protein [Promicromonosporaceae bacterium]|nr:RidA family protein [Promicromonosporaceae bacterium]